MDEIVVATDNIALCTMLQAELAALGFEVLWAMDGHEALDLCAGTEPVAIFIDATVQVISLWELCGQLRSHVDIPPTLAIFILSEIELPRSKRDLYRIQQVVCHTHDTALLREMLARA